MYIHTGNHYFCPITHETDINPVLLNYGSNWYSLADFSSVNKYTGLFNTGNNIAYGWGYALGDGGYGIYDSIANPGSTFGFGYNNNSTYGYTYMMGSGYDILDSISTPSQNSGFSLNPFSPNSNGYTYLMGQGYEILDNAANKDKSGVNFTNYSNPFSNNNSTVNTTTANTQAVKNSETAQHSTVKTHTTNHVQSSTQATPSTNVTSFNRTVKDLKADSKFAKSIVDNAENYIGYNEKDGSFRKFSNSTEWCADFVTYVVKEAYQKSGRTLPAGFGSWRCENLKQWAISNNKFLQTAGKEDKASVIAQQVKPGDILILRENGASHTGIVKTINKSTGEFTTIEGNVTNKNGIDSVVRNNYNPNDPEISGFIQLV